MSELVLNEEEISCIRGGKPIRAIASFRERIQCSLAVAKAVVDKYRDDHNLWNAAQVRVEVSVEPLLRFFPYGAGILGEIANTAHLIVTSCPQSAERTIALRKLLEARDAIVRALPEGEG